MSMLAERKRKTKWVINPTKKPLWTTDSSGIKFGVELMEKMGWSAGKGLGAKEQGIQEPLRVSYKNDTKGMGFKGNDDDWIEHQDEFNVLLSQLRGNDDTSAVETSQKNEVKSLEDISKHSRARVHYQKFTRGKDLSRYSENDLACILGIGKSKKEKSEPEETTKTEAAADGEYETSFGVTTIKGGSIQDYFKKKLNFNKTKFHDSSGTTNETHENDNESFKCEKPVLQNNEDEKIENKDKKHKNKKHKSEVGSTICEVTESCNEELTSKNVDLSLTDNGVEKIKAKKRKQKSESDPDLQELEQTDTPTITANGEKVKNFDVVEANNTEERKIKKKKKKSRKDDDLDGNNETIDIEKKECSFQQENVFEPLVEEKKSKKRKRNSEIETEVAVLDDETNNNPESVEIKHKKKKHKSSSESVIELIETGEYPTNEKDCCNEKCRSEIMGDQIEKKHKKKKKRIHNDESELLNENYEEVIGNENEQNQNADFTYDENLLETSVKKHKKKKHKSKSEDEQMISEVTETHNKDSHPAINDSNEIKEKHKKRKHKSKLDTDSLEKEEIENVSEVVIDSEGSKKPKKEKRKKRRDVSVSECIETVPEKALNDEEPESLPVETENNIERKERKKEKKNKKLEVVEGGDCLLEKVEKKEKKQKTKLKGLKLEEDSTESTEKSNTCSDPIERIVIDETKPEKKKKKGRKGSEDVEKCEEQISAAEAIVREANASAKKTEDKKGQAPDLGKVNGKECEVKISPPAVGASDVQGVNNSGKMAKSVGNGKKPAEEPFQYKSYTTQKVLDLICWADIKEFRGSNLGNVLGYGFKKEYLNKVKVS